MAIYKTKLWTPLDLVLLKWASIIFGMIVGAYLNVFVKQYLWIFILLTIVLAIKPFYSYFIKK